MMRRPIAVAMAWPFVWNIAAVLTLCAATVLLYGANVRFTLIENDRSMPADIAPGLENWNTSPSGVNYRPGGVLELRAVSPASVSFARWRIFDFKQYSFLNVQAEFRVTDLAVEPNEAARVRLAIESFDRIGRPLLHRLKKFKLHTTRPEWNGVRRVVAVGRETAFMRINASLLPGPGTLQLRNLTVSGAGETSLFTTLRTALIVLWATLALWVARPLALRAMKGEKATALILLITGAIYLGTLISKPDLLMIVEGIMDPVADIVVIELPPDAQPMAAPPLPKPALKSGAGQAFLTLPNWFGVEKLGHIILFAALAFLAAVAHPKQSWMIMIAGCGLIAISSEVLQLLGDARFPSMIDLVWDGIGIGAGIATCNCHKYFNPGQT